MKDNPAISYIQLEEAAPLFDTEAIAAKDEWIVSRPLPTFFERMQAILAAAKNEWISFLPPEVLTKAEGTAKLIVCQHGSENTIVSIYQAPLLLGASLLEIAFHRDLAKEILTPYILDESAFLYALLTRARTVQVVAGTSRGKDATEVVQAVAPMETNPYQKQYLLQKYVESYFRAKQGDLASELLKVLPLLDDKVVDQLTDLNKWITALVQETPKNKLTRDVIPLVKCYVAKLTPEKEWLPSYSGLFQIAKKGRYKASYLKHKAVSPFQKRLGQYIGRKLIYPIAKRLAIRTEQVVFLSQKIVHPDDTFLPLYQVIKQQKPEKEIAMYFRSDNYNFRYYLRFFYALGRSKYLFVDDYYYPFYNIRIREEAVVVQLWHAAGAFKKFGHSAIGYADSLSPEFETRAHQNYTHVIASSAEIKTQYAEAFQIDQEKILPLGLPRLWKFYDEAYKQFNQTYYQEMYPALKRKKVILYAPTFRGNSEQRKAFDVPLDLSALREQLGEEYVFFVKLHPLVDKGSLDFTDTADFAFDVSDQNIADLMLIADMLVTDYSSVIFEFALLGKPILFYAYDLENYLEERDFYEAYESYVPGPIVKTEAALIHAIQTETGEAVNDAFVQRNFTYQDGQAAERIIAELMPD